MEHREFLNRAQLQVEVLEAWVAAGWLTPSAGASMGAGGLQFTEIDVARVRLIRDLQGGMGVNDEGVGVILGLIDQLHGLRRTLGDLLSAIHAQPEDMRERLAVHVRRTMTDWVRPAPEREPGPGSAERGSDRQA